MIDFAAIREETGYKAFDTENDRLVTLEELEEEKGLRPDRHGMDRYLASQELPEQVAGSLRAALESAAEQGSGNTFLTLLFDLRGAMRGTPLLRFAGAMEWMSGELDRLNVPHEILGFTTNEWKPQEQVKAIIAMRNAEDPAFMKPGRLGSLLHVVLKEPGEQVESLAGRVMALGANSTLKENIDGEAIEWAYERLMERDEAHKRLVLVKYDHLDPISYATVQWNGVNRSVLFDHMLATLRAIGHEGEVVVDAVLHSRNGDRLFVMDHSKDYEQYLDGVYGSLTSTEDTDFQSLCSMMAATVGQALENRQGMDAVSRP